MLKITRPVCPPLLAAGSAKWADDFVTARAANSQAKFRWRSENSYQQMRASLLTMTLHHCAFCDGLIGAESRETVEHFQPKKDFPHLAYTWENLFPCCDQCQSQKGEAYHQDLLKPDHPTYEFEDYFICNVSDGSIEADPAASPPNQQRANKTIELYGLNLPTRKKARVWQLKLFVKDNGETPLDEFPYRYFISL